MRLSPRSLLVAVALSAIGACTVDKSGLGAQDAGHIAVVVPDGSSAAGSSAAGASGVAGSSGEAGAVAGIGGGGSGEAGGGAAGDGVAGTTGQAGTGGAGSGVAGAAGASGEAGAGPGGQGGAEPPDAGGGAGTGGAGAAGAGGSMGPADAHPISPIGCSDGTREGFKSLDKYPDIAACAGGWRVPGFETTAMCGRSGGNNGVRPDGVGCSVEDLCADGWHVCEGIAEFTKKATDCKDALPTSGTGPGDGTVFYGTRQRGSGMACDLTNRDGTNNIHGCGNFGTAAWNTCAPFMRMLRDADCRDNAPWSCVDGPIDYNVKELAGVTKTGPSRGGVLCCR